MRWKDFFTPDWKKILIATTLFLIFLFVPFPIGKTCYMPQLIGASPICGLEFVSIFGQEHAIKYTPLGPIIISPGFTFDHLYITAELLLLMAGLFLLSYFLSCTAVFVYNKFKNGPVAP